MGKIVVNKHFDNKAQITPDKFVNKGELIISNQVGYEGIFIKNNNGEIFYIGPTEGTGTDVPLEYKEYIETFVNGRLEGYITKEEFNELIKNIQIDPEQVRVIVNDEITSALAIYSTTEEVNSAIAQAISALNIPSLEGYATEEWVEEQGFLQGIPTESIRQIAAEEVAKIVNSADTKYDTLKEISDWILNDTTGAASMANDIAKLKSVSADTRISAIEAISADTRLSAVEAISADTRISAIEAISADTRISTVENKLTGLTSDDIYDQEQGKTQSEINQFLLQGNEESSKHFFMSTTQYADLVENGSVTIDGKEFTYDENAFYALYEPEE